MTHRVLPWAVVVVAATSWVAAIVLALPRQTVPLEASDVLWGLSFLGLTATGAVVVSRQPQNRFGWFLLLGSLGIAVGVLGSDYANRVAEGARWSGGAWVWHLGEVVFAAGSAMLLVSFFRFPDGEPLSGRLWRLLDRSGALMVVVAPFTALLDRTPGIPGSAETWPDPEIFWPSPLANYLPLIETGALGDIVGMVTLLLGLAAFASLFARYRRGAHTVRAQLRWVMWPVVLGLAYLTPILIYDALVDDPLPSILEVMGTTIFTVGIPAGILMAITKTGLYEIDRLIRRTVAYSIVTTVLVAVYATAVLAIGQVARWLGVTGNDVIVALSTLVAAALARPLFTTVRRTIDKRFHRAGRDAERIVDAFRGQLRENVSDNLVRDGLVAAVNQAVAPRFVTIWVREPASAGSETS